MQLKNLAKLGMLGGQPSKIYPGFLPSDMRDLELWLDADDSQSILHLGGLISEWKDKSGNGNNALQGTGANQPALTADTMAGKQTVVFSNDNFLSIADHSSLNFDGGSGFSIFVAVNYDGYDNHGSVINVLLGKGNANLGSDNYNFQTTSNNKITFQSGSNEIITDTGDAINGEAHILTATMDNINTDSTLRVDDDAEFSNSSATVGSDNALDLIIGGDTGVVRYAAGKYAEIIIYSRILSDVEKAQVKAYLSKKWGITLL